MNKLAITGSIPAIVTPFTVNGEIDYDALNDLLEWHIAEGSDAIVVSGTTGESATITAAEQARVLGFVVEQVAKRIPIIAGTGANSTAEAIELANDAKLSGADAHLSVVPYYNKPSQEGMFRHFSEIAEAVDLPMILYNVPGRTVADMSNDTAVRLAGVPGIVGLKDATGDIERGVDLLRRVPEGFAIYSGDDGTAAALMLLGAQGTISVTANVAPRLMHEMCQAAVAGEAKKASYLNAKLSALHHALFLDPNPVPTKWALHRMGFMVNFLRLPLTQMRDEFVPFMKYAMTEAEIQVQ